MFAIDSPELALRYVQIVSATAVAISSLEFLFLRKELAPSGVFSAIGLSSRLFRLLLYIRFVLAILLASPWLPANLIVLVLVVLNVSVLATNRMLVFGLEAADQMISILLFAQLLASLAPHDIIVQKVCLWFIALQASLAYAVAGWAKLLKPNWRNGSYLYQLLRTELFGHAGLAACVARGRTARYLSMLLISLEASFPLALLTGRPGCLFFTVCMLFMHLTNALILGLNLFVLAFAATYPAMLYCAGSLYD